MDVARPFDAPWIGSDESGKGDYFGPLVACAVVPLLPRLGEAVFVLVAVNVGLGVWVAMYLTMIQDVSKTHVSTALGLVSGCGSLAGALAMWAVGRVTQQTGSFTIPMVAFSVAAVIAALAGCGCFQWKEP